MYVRVDATRVHPRSEEHGLPSILTRFRAEGISRGAARHDHRRSLPKGSTIARSRASLSSRVCVYVCIDALLRLYVRLRACVYMTTRAKEDTADEQA